MQRQPLISSGWSIPLTPDPAWLVYDSWQEQLWLIASEGGTRLFLGVPESQAQAYSSQRVGASVYASASTTYAQIILLSQSAAPIRLMNEKLLQAVLPDVPAPPLENIGLQDDSGAIELEDGSGAIALE